MKRESDFGVLKKFLEHVFLSRSSIAASLVCEFFLSHIHQMQERYCLFFLLPAEITGIAWHFGHGIRDIGMKREWDVGFLQKRSENAISRSPLPDPVKVGVLNLQLG